MSTLAALRSRVLSLGPDDVLATFVVFGLQKLIPGVPAAALAGDAATPERLAKCGASSTWTSRCSPSTWTGCAAPSPATWAARSGRGRGSGSS